MRRESCSLLSFCHLGENIPHLSFGIGPNRLPSAIAVGVARRRDGRQAIQTRRTEAGGTHGLFLGLGKTESVHVGIAEFKSEADRLGPRQASVVIPAYGRIHGIAVHGAALA